MKRFVLSAVLGVLGGEVLWAQPFAVLLGRVEDGQTRQPLSGATVRVEGTVLGAVTARSGTFLVRGIPPGEHVVSVTLVGYRRFQRAVQFRAGDTVRLSVLLEPEPIGVEAVVVTAAKRAQTLQEAPVSIATVEASTVQARSFNRLDEVLRTVPGVTVNRDQVSIRGSSGFAYGVGSRTLLLVDGIPLLSGDGGEMKYDALPPLAVERVEVLKGAASALYGTAALGGVVQVLTAEPPEEPLVRFRLYGGLYGRPRFAEWDVGQRGMWGLDLGYAQRIGAVGIYASAAGVRDESYRLANDSRRWQLFGKLRWTPSATSVVTLLGLYADDDRGNWIYWRSLREATRPGNPDSLQRVRSRKAVLAGQWQAVWSPQLTSTVRAGAYRTDFANRLPSGNADTLPQSRATSLTAEWQWSWQPRSRLLATGGVHVIGNTVDATLYGHRRQLMTALYGQLELGMMQPVGLTAGIRLDWERTEGLAPQPVEVSPRIGVTYATWFGAQLRASIGRAFRAPTVAERFASVQAAGFTVRANPALQPERGWSAEIGLLDTLWLPMVLWRSPLAVNVALFRSDYYGFIEPEFRAVDGQVAVQFVNLTRARVQGVEVTLRTWLGPALPWSSSGAVGVEAGITMMEPWDVTRNDWLRYRPRRLATVQALVPLPWGEFQAEYRYQSRVERVDEEFVNLGLIRHADARVPVHVVDVRLSVSGARFGIPLTLTFNVRNLLDYYYTEVPGNLAPVRQFVVQVAGER